MPSFVHFLPTAPKVSGKSELPSASIQNVVRVDRTKDASKNGEPERACADRKRKIEAISVDNDLREMVIIRIIHAVSKPFMPSGQSGDSLKIAA